MLSLVSFEERYVGTVSEGTLKTQFLVSTFKQMLRWLVRENAKGITGEDHRLLAYEWYDEEYLDTLFNRLDAIGSEYGYYFGAHPDDGACFGFWKIEEGN